MGRVVWAEWAEYIDAINSALDLGIEFAAGDNFDFLKIALSLSATAASILATLFFGRRYVRRKLRKLLDDQVNKIASSERIDRQHIKKVIKNSAKKYHGTRAKITPFDTSSSFGAAALAFASRRPEQSIELLDRETQLSLAAAKLCEKRAQIARNKAATAQLQIGLIRKEQGDSSGALRAFKEVLILLPDDEDGLRFAGHELRSQGRHDEARTYFSRLEQVAVGTDNRPLMSEALRALAQVNNNLTDAITQLDQSREIDRAIHNELGIGHAFKIEGDIRREKRHWNKARDAYEKAIPIFTTLQHKEVLDEIENCMKELRAQRQSGELA